MNSDIHRENPTIHQTFISSASGLNKNSLHLLAEIFTLTFLDDLWKSLNSFGSTLLFF